MACVLATAPPAGSCGDSPSHTCLPKKVGFRPPCIVTGKRNVLPYPLSLPLIAKRLSWKELATSFLKVRFLPKTVYQILVPITSSKDTYFFKLLPTQGMIILK